MSGHDVMPASEEQERGVIPRHYSAESTADILSETRLLGALCPRQRLSVQRVGRVIGVHRSAAHHATTMGHAMLGMHHVVSGMMTVMRSGLRGYGREKDSGEAQGGGLGDRHI